MNNDNDRFKAVLLGKEGDEFGGDFDGEGQEAVESHEQAALAAAPGFQKAALVAVHRAADYPHAVAVHRRGDFLWGIVADIALLTGGVDEARHLGGAHGEGDTVAEATGVAVLQGSGALDGGSQQRLRCVDEEEVVDDGDGLTYASSRAEGNACDHRSEDLEAFLLEQPPCRYAGIGTSEVAHHEPFDWLVHIISEIFGDRQ